MASISNLIDEVFSEQGLPSADEQKRRSVNDLIDEVMSEYKKLAPAVGRTPPPAAERSLLEREPFQTLVDNPLMRFIAEHSPFQPLPEQPEGLIKGVLKAIPQAILDMTISPFKSAGQVLTEGRTPEQARAFEAMTPEEQAVYRESGRAFRSPFVIPSEELAPQAGSLGSAAFYGFHLRRLPKATEAGPIKPSDVGAASPLPPGLEPTASPPEFAIPEREAARDLEVPINLPPIPSAPPARQPLALPPAPPLVVTPEGLVLPRYPSTLGLSPEEITAAQGRRRAGLPPSQESDLPPRTIPVPTPQPPQAEILREAPPLTPSAPGPQESISAPSERIQRAVVESPGTTALPQSPGIPNFGTDKLGKILNQRWQAAEKGLEGGPDYIGDLNLKIRDEAERPLHNLIIGLENARGDPDLLVKNLTIVPRTSPKAKTADSGLYGFSQSTRSDLDMPLVADAQRQVRGAEQLFDMAYKEVGRDPRAVAAWWLNRARTRNTLRDQPVNPEAQAAMPEDLALPKFPRVAGGGPKGAELIAEAHGDALGMPFIEPQLTTAHFKLLADASADYMRRYQMPFDPKKGRLVYQLADNIAAGRADIGHFTDYLRTKGIENPEATLAEAFGMEKGREAGRTLNVLSQIMKSLEEKTDSGAATPPEQKVFGYLKRWDNVRRLLQTSQVATAARNAETQALNLGMDAFADAVNNIFSLAVTGKTPNAERAIFGPLERVWRLGRTPGQAKAATETLLERFPSERDRFFGSYQGDIENPRFDLGPVKGMAEAVTRGAEKTAFATGIFNRVQEYAARRIAFLSKMEQIATEKGIREPIYQVNPNIFTKAEVQEGVTHALEMTWATRPEAGSVQEAFVKVVNAFPFLATGPIPYPRFMANAFRWLYEWSPMNKEGLSTAWKLLSSEERASIASGDTKALVKSIVGTTMFYTAYQLRLSDQAGPKPWEFKAGRDDKGRDLIWDTRPYNPFVPYLIVGDFFARMKKGTLSDTNIKDYVEGILSVNLRAGAGLYLLDNTAELIKEIAAGDLTKPALVRSLKEYGGTLASGYATPFRILKDAVAQFDKSENVQRATRIESFLGPVKAAIPWLSQTLPEAASPFEAKRGPQQVVPAVRQLTGIGFSTKPPVQMELERHGFDYRSILPPQGHPEADLALAKAMGPLIERALGQIIQSPSYQTMGRDRQKFVLAESVKGIRQVATPISRQTISPQAAYEVWLRSIPPAVRSLIFKRPEVIRQLEQRGISP